MKKMIKGILALTLLALIGQPSYAKYSNLIPGKKAAERAQKRIEREAEAEIPSMIQEYKLRSEGPRRLNYTYWSSKQLLEKIIAALDKFKTDEENLFHLKQLLAELEAIEKLPASRELYYKKQTLLGQIEGTAKKLGISRLRTNPENYDSYQPYYSNYEAIGW